MAPVVTSLPGLSLKLSGSLDERVDKLKSDVVDRAYAKALARVGSNSTVPSSATPNAPVAVLLGDVSEAFDEVIGKREIKVPELTFLDHFPPFTCLSFLLCIIFGFFGFLKSNPGFLDVSKIFAGALVGSTASSALSSKKRVR